MACEGTFQYQSARELGANLEVAGYFPAGNLDLQYLMGGVRLFATTGVQIRSTKLFHGLMLVSEDPLFGAGVPSTPLQKGTDYWLEVIAAPLTFDLIFCDDLLVWEEPPTYTKKIRRIPIRAGADGPALIRFFRHRKRAAESEFLMGRHALTESTDTGGQSGEFPEIAVPMALSLDIRCKILPSEKPHSAVAGSQFSLPPLRSWMSPRLYRETPVLRSSGEPFPEAPPVSYAVEDITAVENHDLYLQVADNPEWKIDAFATLEQRLRLCDRLGLRVFNVSASAKYPLRGQPTFFVPGYVEKLLEFRRQGIGKSINTLLISVPMVADRDLWSEDLIAEQLRMLEEILESDPEIEIWLRGSEINTNGQWQRHGHWPGYLNCRSTAGLETYAIRKLFISEFQKLIAMYRSHMKHPERCRFYIQGDGPISEGGDCFHSGFDILTCKNIHRINTNVVVAFGRGVARAAGHPIGLAYDSWVAGYYCMTNPVEVEHIFRCYYWSGAQIVDYEAQFLGVDAEGKLQMTEAGAAYYHWLAWARRHPLRGTPRIKIAWLKGTDDGGIRPTAPGGSRYGLREDILQHEHPALLDWNFLDLTFPHFGDYQSSNPLRYLTGTPFGAADVVPADCGLAHLKTFSVACVTGRNRMTPQMLADLVEFVNAGGTLVLALEHVLTEDQSREKYIRGIDRLLGAQLGEDLECATSEAPGVWPARTRFYNRVKPQAAEVLKSLENGDPLLLRHTLGAGRVFFFVTEYLHQAGEENVRELLRNEFSKTRAVHLDPPSDWIQIDLFERDGIWILSLLNHGRSAAPAGLGVDAGAWHGTVHLHGAPENSAVAETGHDFHLCPIPVERTMDGIRFHATVDRWAEFVIGPESSLQSAYLRKNGGTGAA